MLHPSGYPGAYRQFQEKGRSSFTDNMDQTLGGFHVLVVHSSLDILNLMAAMFLKFGYQVTTARDSANALLSFGRNPCDLLFTDLEMPVLDGYHLARLVKKHHPQTKTVAMTCCCQAEVIDLMGDGIVDGWLFKPFKTNRFRDTLIGIGMVNEAPHTPEQEVDHISLKGQPHRQG